MSVLCGCGIYTCLPVPQPFIMELLTSVRYLLQKESIMNCRSQDGIKDHLSLRKKNEVSR